KRDIAIVTPEPGTTRDLIEVKLDLGGYPVTLVDTAGLRQTEGVVEREGIRRAEARAAAADLVLWLTDVTVGEPAAPPPSPYIRFARKVVLIDSAPKRWAFDAAFSSATGQGIPELLQLMTGKIADVPPAESVLTTRVRHRTAVSDALAAMR